MLKIDFLVVSSHSFCSLTIFRLQFRYTMQYNVRFTSSSYFFSLVLFGIFVYYGFYFPSLSLIIVIVTVHLSGFFVSFYVCACAGARAYKRKPVIKRNIMFVCLCAFVCVREHRITKINLCKITKVLCMCL